MDNDTKELRVLGKPRRVGIRSELQILAIKGARVPSEHVREQFVYSRNSAMPTIWRPFASLERWACRVEFPKVLVCLPAVIVQLTVRPESRKNEEKSPSVLLLERYQESAAVVDRALTAKDAYLAPRMRVMP